MAIRWVAEAWDSVQEETIRKCFTKSGITWSSFSVVRRLHEDEDPFDNVEAQQEFHDLFDQILPSETNCPVEEYINGVMQYDDDWEDHFFAELGRPQVVLALLVQVDPDDEGQFHLNQKSHGFRMRYPHLRRFSHSWIGEDSLKRQQGLHHP